MKLLTREVTPPSHSVYVKWDDVARLRTEEVQALRRRIGVIYQDYKLLSARSVLENVMLPLQVWWVDDLTAKEKALNIMKEFDFATRSNNKIAFLSWWEKQKVAVMRALVGDPQLLIADEPTWNLDRDASAMIADMLMQINKKWHTILLITHDQQLITYIQEKLAWVRVTEII
jgi:cell division transport system ATP-binding protein